MADPSPDAAPLPSPLFDSKDVEMNAATLLRFLQTNCSRDGATYLLQREEREEGEGGAAGQGIDIVRL